jgi:hypothetical protein
MKSIAVWDTMSCCPDDAGSTYLLLQVSRTWGRSWLRWGEGQSPRVTVRHLIYLLLVVRPTRQITAPIIMESLTGTAFTIMFIY